VLIFVFFCGGGVAGVRLRLLKNTKITGERCSPLHINSVFTPIVGDGALDVPLLSNFFNKLGRPWVACVSHF